MADEQQNGGRSTIPIVIPPNPTKVVSEGQSPNGPKSLDLNSEYSWRSTTFWACLGHFLVTKLSFFGHEIVIFCFRNCHFLVTKLSFFCFRNCHFLVTKLSFFGHKIVVKKLSFFGHEIVTFLVFKTVIFWFEIFHGSKVVNLQEYSQVILQLTLILELTLTLTSIMSRSLTTSISIAGL
jgi:hypothetical protein